MSLLSPLSDPRGAPGFDTGDKTQRSGLWMVKHRGGRGRAKRRRCAFVVMEECGNVPAPCQTSLKGVRAHSAGVGKPARDGAHTGVRGRGCMGLPGDTWERKGSREKGENPKEKRGLGRPGSSICLCPLTPTTTDATSSHPTPPPHNVAVRVRVWVFVKHSSLLLLHLLPLPAWVSLPGLVQSERWGLQPAPSDYLCGPRMEHRDAFDAGRFYPRRQCLLSILSDMSTPPHCVDSLIQGKHLKSRSWCRIWYLMSSRYEKLSLLSPITRWRPKRAAPRLAGIILINWGRRAIK